MLYKYNSVSGLSPPRDHLSRKKTERVAQIRSSGVWCCWASKHQHGNTDHRSPRTSSHINCCMTSSGEGVRCCAAELPPLLLSWTNPARKLPAPHSAYEWCSHAIRNLPLLNGQRKPFISKIGTDLTDGSSLSVTPLLQAMKSIVATAIMLSLIHI